MELKLFFKKKILFNVYIQPFSYDRPIKNHFSNSYACNYIYTVYYYPMVFNSLFFFSIIQLKLIIYIASYPCLI